jgi:hypothetical protein
MNLPKLHLNQVVLKRLMLVAMALAAVLYLGWTYCIGPLRTEKQGVERDLLKMRDIYADNRRLVSASRNTQKRYETERAAFLKTMHDTLAPSVNGMAWAGDVYRSVILPGDAVARPLSSGEVGTFVPPVISRDAPPPVFEEYLVRSDHSCDFRAFGRFLASLERANPSERLDGLEIRSPVDVAKDKAPLLLINLRTAFVRFNDIGFPTEERPDAEVPRVLPKVHNKEGEAN